MDRKYEYREGGLWHREGGYMVPADEPQMTLRGKDPDAIAAIEAYIRQCNKVYRETGDEQALMHFLGAAETRDEFLRFQAINPHRVKRGCHECG